MKNTICNTVIYNVIGICVCKYVCKSVPLLKGSQRPLWAAPRVTITEGNQPGDRHGVCNTLHMVRGWKKILSAITTKTSAPLERSCGCSVVHREQPGFACLCGYCYKVSSVYTTLPDLTCPSDVSAIKYGQRFDVTSGLAGTFSSERGARWSNATESHCGFGCLDVEGLTQLACWLRCG